jgi:diguanylate cyclase (GGDEF)-like protein
VRPEPGGLSVELERAYDPSAALLGRRLLTPLRLRVALAEPTDPTTFAFVRDLLVLVAEIHRREHDAQRLAREAHTDPLTGLWNRRGFTSFVEQAIARYARAGEPATLLLCDLDHFKRINDNHGHEVGDQTLQAVAQAIHQVTRDTDVGGRLGGDELAILLAGACADQGLTVARRLREVLQATSRALGLPVTLSVGIADTRALARRGDTEPLVSLLRSADEALYLAKANGRDQAQLAVP